MQRKDFMYIMAIITVLLCFIFPMIGIAEDGDHSAPSTSYGGGDPNDAASSMPDSGGVK